MKIISEALKPVLTFPLFLFILPLQAGASGGEKDLPPDDEEVIEERTEPGTEGMSPSLKAALEYFEERRYETASLALYEALGHPDNHPFYPKIHFSLARSLEGMHLYQSAILFYSETLKWGKDTPYFEEAFLRCARVSRKMEDHSDFLKAIISIPPEAFPERERGFSYYIIAKYLFEKEKHLEAKAFLGAIPVDDPWYDNSRHLLSVILTKERRYREAVTTYLTLLALPDRDQEREDLKLLALINLGRIFYAHKNFDRAIEFFREVDRDSPYWVEILFETAWSYFMKADYNGALSQLQTITSPFFRDFYIPEAELLRIIILYYTCKFADGSRILDRFLKKYAPFKERLNTFLGEYGNSPIAAFDQVARFSAYPGPKGGVLPWGLLNLFITDERLRLGYKHITYILLEMEDFSRFGTWGDSELRRELDQRITRHMGEIKRVEGERTLARLKDIYSQLVYFMNQSQISQLEMITREKEMYEAAMYGTVKEKELLGKPKKVHVPEGHRLWPFEGEFWIDELGYYVVFTEDECPEFGMETKGGSEGEGD